MNHAPPPGWKAHKLNQLGFLGRGRSRHRPRDDASLYGGDYPFFQTGDVKAANLYLSEYSQTYNKKGLAQSRQWEPGTLCITIAANIAETAILGIRGCFPDSVIGFVADPAQADVQFIKYCMDLMKQDMQQVSHGTTQDNLSLDKLLRFDFVVPDAREQRKIAAILSAYDNLIQNNLRRIKILEEMAQNLYREWFVKFRFPGYEQGRFTGYEQGRFTDSPLGRIPEGWEVVQLSSVVDFAKGRKPVETRNEPIAGDVRLLLIDALRGGEPQFTAPVRLVIAETRDTIMVMDGGSSCEVAQGFSGAVGSTLGRFRTTEPDRFSPHALYRFLEEKADEFKSKNIGAAIPHANKDYILRQMIPLPPQTITLGFHGYLEPIQGTIETLRAENTTLRRTRDLLLPRLISGEVDVSELDIAVPEGALA